MRPRIYLTQPIAPNALARLRALGEVEANADTLHIPSEQELIAAAERSDILFCLLHDRITRNVIAANPRLKAIVSTTITPADIDIAAASAHRIPVTTIPSSLLDDATADLAWALLMALARRVAEADRHARAGIIPGSQSLHFAGSDVSGRTLGLLGVGGVGREMARRALGFKMRTLYHDPRRLSAEDEARLHLSWVGFDALLREAEFVSLHVALGPGTRHLVDARALGLMRPDAYLVNTARGPIVDERALIEALEQGRIAGAALDVFETEPAIDPRLLALPNVVVTPHIGSATRCLREAMAAVAIDNLVAVLAGRRPPNCWNPEIYHYEGRAT
ncbi:MAG: D-glycerate dehydrogenase [Burkholderiales bacterium]|nr:D-glycerate dehydrogenase [Burkholderiales bacterium]